MVYGASHVNSNNGMIAGQRPAFVIVVNTFLRGMSVTRNCVLLADLLNRTCLIWKLIAEQTLDQIYKLKKYLKEPIIEKLLVIGKVTIRKQIDALKSGIDIVVPGRLE